MRNSRFTRLRKRPVAVATAVGALVLGALVVAPGEAAIAPSTFNGTNGDVTTTQGKDWVDLTNLVGGPIADGGRVYKNDLASGQGDNSFTQGTSENTEPPVPDTGSIPPNKSDLTRFYLGTEKVSGKQFLYLAWARVLDPNGTTNMDFEFNQGSDGTSANNVTPKRMHGDVLIEYKLSKGGTVPSIFMYRWLTVAGGDLTGFPTTCEAGDRPCWSAKKDLTATGFAEGSVNTAAITDSLVSPSVTRTAYTFGEASVDLTGAGLFTAGQCTTFGSAYLKSRSSDSFTAALKDYIAPLTINLTNCGSLTVVKQTSPAGADQEFDFAVTGGATTVAPFKLKDASDTPTASQVKTITNVQPGSYTITETVPTGWVSTGATCTTGTTSTTNAITVSVGTTNVTCTFTNALKPKLTLVKEVDNDAGGTASVTDWTLKADGTGANDIQGVTGTDDVTDVPVDAGTFTLSEFDGPPGYSASDWVCTGATSSTVSSVTLSNGDDATCTITNTALQEIPLARTTQKWVVQDSLTLSPFRTGAGDADMAKATFTLYKGLTCTAASKVGQEVVTGVTDGTAATTDGIEVTDTGFYSWVVAYSGDAFNQPVTLECGDEVTLIRAKDWNRDDLPQSP